MMDRAYRVHIEHDPVLDHRAAVGGMALPTGRDLAPSPPGPSHQAGDVGDRSRLENSPSLFVNNVAEIVCRYGENIRITAKLDTGGQPVRCVGLRRRRHAFGLSR